MVWSGIISLLCRPSCMARTVEKLKNNVSFIAFFYQSIQSWRYILSKVVCIIVVIWLEANHVNVTAFPGKSTWPRHLSSFAKEEFHCRKALIVSKLSRYEFEKYRHPSLSTLELEEALRRRGSDYELLLHHHHIHKACETSVEAALKAHGIETRVVNRWAYITKVSAFAAIRTTYMYSKLSRSNRCIFVSCLKQLKKLQCMHTVLGPTDYINHRHLSLKDVHIMHTVVPY